MDWTIIVLLVLGLPILLAIWLIVRAFSARASIEMLTRRLDTLEIELARLRRQSEPLPAEPIAAERPTPAPSPTPPVPLHTQPAAPEHVWITPPPPLPKAPQPLAPSPLPIPPSVPEPIGVHSRSLAVDPPPPLQESTPPPVEPPTRETVPNLGWETPKIDWERFMGVKMFAWIGGLALFLGVAFFVKYSFDNNLVPPELRVAIGFLAGLGALVGGVVMSRKNHSAQPQAVGGTGIDIGAAEHHRPTVLAQTLCATGIVILYAVTFACRSIYHFQFFGTVPTFLLMVLITTTAFLLAVRLDALVVAILGMLGGFLTPILLSTGVDNPLGLFGYIAILDVGLILVALRRRWSFLTALAAAGTAFMQVGWAGDFFEKEKYFEGNKILVALAVLLGFVALFVAASWQARPRQQANRWFWGSALALVAVSLLFAAWFLTFAPLAQRPWLMFGFVFLIDLAVAALVPLDDEVAPARPIAGLAVFALLAFWTSTSLKNDLLNAALVCYFVFAVLHSVFPFVMQRRRGAGTPVWGSQIFPPLALVLVLIPIFHFAEVSFLVWPFVLLVDVLAIGLAVMTATLLPVVAVLLLTLGATGALIFKIPGTLTGLPTSFFLLGAFAVFFVAVSLWLARKFKPEAFSGASQWSDDLSDPGNLAAQLPSISVVLPFLLLIMAVLRLPLANSAPVFGLALLLVVLLLGIARLFLLEWMPAVGLVCVAALECAWHFDRFDAARANPTLAWYLIFLAVFALFPFLFLRRFENKIVPWAAAAMAGLPQFFLIHRLVKAAYPNHVMGLLPAAFALLPLASLGVVLKKIPATVAARMTQLAWFGGVALFFITLIFPIQFDRQWITIGWALEGVALLWLFHRLPHPGLRLAGVGLLVAAFVRLACNPAVLEYHARSTTPIFNWYLYAYGIVTICLFVGVQLLAPPRHQVLDTNARPILGALGTGLAFLLLNIEIADFFSAPGSTLTFQFSGDFARDMTYSIAWALFALVLLVVGILRTIPAARYAALGLLCVTLLKLFLHDLAQLGQLYRIGAFVGVALIAMLASFAYQRFFSALASAKTPKNEPTP